MKNTKTLLAIVFSLLSATIFGYLSYKHFGLKFGTSISPSLCNISDTFNCDAVSASSYSELFGIPLAVWGLSSQIILAALLVVQYIFSSHASNRYAFWLSSISLVAAVVMAVISFTLMSTYCLFCIFSYITIFITWFLVFKNQQSISFVRDIKALLGSDKAFLTFFALIPLLAFIVNDSAAGDNQKQMKYFIETSLLQWERAPNVSLPTLSSTAFGANEEDAVMTIAEFADFNCIHCKVAAPVLHSFVKAHPKTRLVFYHFPLDSGCNPLVPRPGISCDMAKAVFCGHSLSPTKGWSAHNAMFETEKPLSREEAVSLVTKEAEVEQEAINTCMNSEETQSAISNQAKLGGEVGVQGTPTIFVNNKKLPGGNNLQILQALYKKLSAQK